ncbi:DUF6577 family protein [Candidatus Brachybacter algidus]|uniref:DUF6577 family protein n=1 Tax=Candidatus Brachybacter algidus TaxID=2982024 RepID=UPI00338E814D
MENGSLERIGRGKFMVGKNQIFVPAIKNNLKVLNNSVLSIFPFIEICVWSTSLFNEFSKHQSNVVFTMVEVEKTVEESVFLYLKEHNKNVFLNPKKELLSIYIVEINNPIIVKSLVSESPLQKVNTISTITIEKALVDLYCDEGLFFFFQGKERSVIFKEAFKKYTINKNKLFRYASRRGKREDIEQYIQIIGI